MSIGCGVDLDLYILDFRRIPFRIACFSIVGGIGRVIARA